MPRPALPLFRSVLPWLVAWVGAQAGFATVLAAWVGAQAGFATVSGLGRCPGLGLGLGIGLVLVLAVAVGRRKHNFTQLNRIKIHNFNYDQCGAPYLEW